MFICIEGLAGSGKTTQTELLRKYIAEEKKLPVFVSAAYEGERRKISAKFMNESGIINDDNAIMFFFQALHALQYDEVQDALARGKTVLADRWRYSFFAHHLEKNTFESDLKLAEAIDRLAFRDLEPDVCLLIDVPAEVAYQRYLNREQAIGDNGLNLMDLEYFTRVSEFYRNEAHKRGWKIIDGSGAPEEVFDRVKGVLD